MAQSEQEILEGLAEIVNEETGLDTASVEMDKSFTEDLDIDSLSMMTIVVNAEEKFGVRIPDSEVKNLKTVARRRHLHRRRPVLMPRVTCRRRTVSAGWAPHRQPADAAPAPHHRSQHPAPPQHSTQRSTSP